MRSIPQGPRRMKSKSSGLRGASSLQDTKTQGAGDSTRDWVGWALHMTILIRVNSIINAFSVLNFSQLFACLCWLVPTLLAKLPVNFYAFQKESELKNAKVSFKRHFYSVI